MNEPEEPSVDGVGSRRHDLDASWRRLRRDEVLAGSPLRLFRVTDAGARLLDDLEAGAAIEPNALVDRLLDAGAIHPRPAPPGVSREFTTSDVTVVTPCFRSAASVGGPGAEPAPTSDITRVARVVVDDASPTPVPGATIRLEHNLGPAGARNAGRRRVDTALIAFVDDDVDVGAGAAVDDWLEPLIGHFDDPAIGLVAPRVIGDPTSSLDLGDRPARIRSGTRVSYVPAAAIVVRAAAFDDVGGFDETLRFGEDVDLVWRLDQAGWRCRYEPKAVVHHRPRPTLAGRLRQQVGYGSAAAPLALRHPNELAPWRGDVPLALLAVIVAAGLPRTAVGVAAAQVVRLRRRLPALSVSEAVDLTLRADLDALVHLARTIRRTWWPIALVLAVPSRRARRMLAVAFLAAARSVLTDLAHGWGVWSGMRRTRTLRPLLPRIG